MPIRIHNVDRGRGVVIAGSGVLTGKELLSAHKRHLTRPAEEFGKLRYSFADWSAVGAIQVRASHIRELASLCRSAALANRSIVVANVSPRDALFGLTRMWEILSEETRWECRAFRARDPALEWLKQRIAERFSITDVPILDGRYESDRKAARDSAAGRESEQAGGIQAGPPAHGPTSANGEEKPPTSHPPRNP